MKKLLCLAAGMLALNLTPVFGQPAATPPQPVSSPLPAPGRVPRYAPPASTFSERLAEIQARAGADQANAPGLTKFNLDFPGGTPKELVTAIEKAMGKPLNVIIPDEFAGTKLPALKMSNVDVPQLFKAVVNMSYKYEVSMFNQARNVVSSFGFESKDSQLSDDSIWYFFVYKAPTAPPALPPEKVCQFYSLSPYLDRGFTVDDITTAIQTGWKMAGITPTPELSYHKETKMLITFGEPGKLKTIDDVLRTLPAVKTEYIAQMNRNISALAQQVHELQKSVSASATNSPPAEKSGK